MISNTFLQMLGLDRETSPALLLIGGFLTAFAFLVLLTEGNVLAAGSPILLLGLVALTIYRLDYSLMLLVGLVLLFDQFPVPGFSSLTSQVEYFKNIKEISYLPNVEVLMVNPIEIHLLLLLFTGLVKISIQRRFRLNRIAAWGGFLMLFAWMVFSLLQGMRTGGDFLVALWEVRALFYFALLYIMVPQIIQTKSQLKMLFWVFIAVISIKALQGVFRFAAMGFSFQGRAALTSHEDPIFMITLIILLFALWLFGSRNRHRTVLSWLSVLLAAGFLVSLRRAAIASLAVSMVALFMLLPAQKQRTFLKWSLPIVLLMGAYGAVSWDSQSKWARPVQMVKSGVLMTEVEQNSEDYYSNLFRSHENYNLSVTVRQAPLMGTGYGKKFDQPLDLADIGFPLKDYIPHNQILWVFAKTGAIGFFLFWLFFNAFAFQGAYILQRLTDPFLKAVCLVIVVAIINQMVVSYFDLQLTYYRNMIYLGTLMGLLPVLQEIQGEQADEEEEESRKMVATL